MTDVTQFEFALLKGEKGRGGTPVGVKAPYELTRLVEGEAAVEEAIELPPEEEIPSTEIPEDTPIEESLPESQPEPEPEVEAAPEVETVVKPEIEEEEEVKPVIEEPVVEEVVEEQTPAPLDYSNVVITFDPESPQQTDNRVDITGTITGLSEPEYFLMINRKVNGNGTEFVKEVGLIVDGERTVVSNTNALNPVFVCPSTHPYQPQVYPFPHP